MFRRKKTYKAKFWCANCGKDLKAKLPFGVIPVKDNQLTHLYDVHNMRLVNQRGVQVAGPEHIYCPNCGSYELSQYKWATTKV
jgi:predicted RNA-binding Zn-ribbon protein involved in translation (DUF1610 family)